MSPPRLITALYTCKQTALSRIFGATSPRGPYLIQTYVFGLQDRTPDSSVIINPLFYAANPRAASGVKQRAPEVILPSSFYAAQLS